MQFELMESHSIKSAYMPEAWRVGNVNELTSLDYNDPITGFVTMKSVPCRVEKAEITMESET